MTTPINLALEALTVASQDGGENDLPHYRRALQALRGAVDSVREHDRKLNTTERAPTGEDYEHLLDILGLKANPKGEGAQ